MKGTMHATPGKNRQMRSNLSHCSRRMGIPYNQVLLVEHRIHPQLATRLAPSTQVLLITVRHMMAAVLDRRRKMTVIMATQGQMGKPSPNLPGTKRLDHIQAIHLKHLSTRVDTTTAAQSTKCLLIAQTSTLRTRHHQSLAESPPCPNTHQYTMVLLVLTATFRLLLKRP